MFFTWCVGERERIERKCKAREFGAVLYSNACLVFLYEESRNLFEDKEKEKKEVKLLFLLLNGGGWFSYFLLWMLI
ncbi:hypothetical protein IMY05_011G0073700 [Salix suchowensis]|nr:hypothetical protein IMY05_011G0073700 [Salix suchowensis]